MIPIRVRQFPRFALQAIKRDRILRRSVGRQPIFHLCYFSCQSYFRYLYCSLHSLVLHAPDISYKVLVFSDEEMPLSAAQIAAIHDLIPEARVIPWPKSMGWGAKQIGWIWRAYQVAVDGAGDNDVIARVDSDVFFFNDRIFRAVERSDADLVGDGHYVNFEYTQGGCYFFRASAVRRICAMLEKESIEEIVKEVNVVVEDVVAHHFARRLGMKIWLLWFMMFPDELKNSGGLTKWQRWKFSCAHFVMKNKAAMLHAYDREVLYSSPSERYRCAMEIE